MNHLQGKRFGRLTVIRPVGVSSTRHLLWLCRCDCGNETTRSTNRLRLSNKNQSCGCWIREVTSRRSLKHGHNRSGSKTYNVWVQMRRRCREGKKPSYVGIEVDPYWNDFENFLADMGECPPGMTLDRIHNDQGYNKGNCRWATPRQQANNRSNNRRITVKGETKTLAQWCRHLKLNQATVTSRLQRGWDESRALGVAT